MGVDIHIKLLDNTTNKILNDDLFPNRNYDFFDNLQGGGGNALEYNFLPTKHGMPENADPADLENFNEGKYYYGFYHINLEELMNWYENYSPQLVAGWISTYDYWLYTDKGIFKEDNIYYYLSSIEENERADYSFHVMINPYDPMTEVIERIKESIPNNKYKNYTVYYYFDH